MELQLKKTKEPGSDFSLHKNILNSAGSRMKHPAAETGSNSSLNPGLHQQADHWQQDFIPPNEDRVCVDMNIISGVRWLGPHILSTITPKQWVPGVSYRRYSGQWSSSSQKNPKCKNINLKKNKKKICKWIARQARSTSLKSCFSTFNTAVCSF